ncbi:MAG: hypothetical protein GX622_08405 [Bacteroidales bacterium]|nr:hypothetical protein [Bacteroidales bacterium]
MKRYEATAAVGTTQFYGDIGGFRVGENALGFKDITLIQTRFSINGSFRYFITDNIAARISFTYGMLHADDARGHNELRGYETSSFLYEPALFGEYYIVRNRERNSFLFQTYRYRRTTRLRDFFRSIDVYALTGIGGSGYNVFYGNDKIQVEKWDQDPTLKRSRFTAVIPLGVGAKLAIDPNLLIGVELAGRYALSDYLDGYTSADSRRNDAYHTFSVTLNYRIKTARNGLPAFR